LLLLYLCSSREPHLCRMARKPGATTISTRAGEPSDRHAVRHTRSGEERINIGVGVASETRVATK
jgi:hypothetical protein